MPAYPGAIGSFVPANSNLSPISLEKAQSVYVFGTPSSAATQLPPTDGQIAQETLIAPQASIAVTLASQMGDPPPMVTVEVRFSAAPGAFSFQSQEADTDADGFYVTPTAAAYTITAVNAITFVARVDLSPTGGKFMRAYLSSLANGVKTSCKITRLA